MAGPGNNGGDGFVCARILAERGYPVRLLLLGDRGRLKGDAAEAADRWQGAVEAATPAALAGAGIIVDALFGAGLDRPVEGAARAMIEAINAAGVPVIAVDLPSGINGDSGAVMGAAVQASETVTFFRRKPGHLLLPGRLHCGPVEVADIGIADAVLERIRPNDLRQRADALGATAFRCRSPAATNIGAATPWWSRATLSHTGAARLAARGALRAGAGLVTIASPRDALAINAASQSRRHGACRSMARPSLRRGSPTRGSTPSCSAPAAGSGDRMREMVLAALVGERAVVLDADALTSFAETPETLFCRHQGARAAPTVLTPHEGEFARLFKSDAARR